MTVRNETNQHTVDLVEIEVKKRELFKRKLNNRETERFIQSYAVYKTPRSISMDINSLKAAATSCQMASWAKQWAPGKRRLFDLHQVSCLEKHYSSMTICIVSKKTGPKQKVPNSFAIISFDLYKLIPDPMISSCTLNLVNYTGGVNASSRILPTRYSALFHNYLNVLSDKVSQYYNSSSFRLCIDLVRNKALVQDKEQIGVSKSRGIMRLNKRICKMGLLYINNQCLNIALALTKTKPTNTEHAIKAYQAFFLHHKICKFSDTKNGHLVKLMHGWCVQDWTAILFHKTTTESPIVVGKCRRNCFISEMSECVSMWTVGEALFLEYGSFAVQSFRSLKMKTFAQFTCSNNRTIPWYNVCYGVQDCLDNEDEGICRGNNKTDHVLEDHTYIFDKSNWICENRNMLPCQDESESCFPIANSCVFDLDENENLRFCHNGGHLHGCENVICSNMFKCPG